VGGGGDGRLPPRLSPAKGFALGSSFMSLRQAPITALSLRV
jgi:hypothetical protein